MPSLASDRGIRLPEFILICSPATQYSMQSLGRHVCTERGDLLYDISELHMPRYCACQACMPGCCRLGMQKLRGPCDCKSVASATSRAVAQHRLILERCSETALARKTKGSRPEAEHVHCTLSHVRTSLHVRQASTRSVHRHRLVIYAIVHGAFPRAQPFQS